MGQSCALSRLRSLVCRSQFHLGRLQRVVEPFELFPLHAGDGIFERAAFEVVSVEAGLGTFLVPPAGLIPSGTRALFPEIVVFVGCAELAQQRVLQRVTLKQSADKHALIFMPSLTTGGGGVMSSGRRSVCLSTSILRDAISL